VDYNPAVTIRREVYEQYGETLESIFDPITARLTNDKMIELNARVDVDNDDPSEVATAFLTESGLLD